MTKDSDFFAEIFKTAVQPIIVLDEQGVIQQLNPAAVSLFKDRLENLKGSDIKDILPDFNINHPDLINVACECQLNHHQDEPKTLYLTMSKSTIDAKNYYICMSHDLSRTKELDEKNHKLIKFSKHMTETIAKVNQYRDFINAFLASISELFNFSVAHFYEYRKISNNLESSNIFYFEDGCDFSEFEKVTLQTKLKKGQGLSGLSWEKNDLIIFDNVYKAINFPRSELSEKMNITSGVAFPVLFNKQILGVVEFFSSSEISFSDEDLSLLKELSRSASVYYGLYYENRNYNLIFTSAGEGIYGLDTSGCITFINPAACKILGYSAEELIGKNMHEKVQSRRENGEPYPIAASPITNTLMDGESHYILDDILWTQDGKPVFVEYKSTPIYENNSLVGAVVTFVDVSSEHQFKEHVAKIAKIQERYIAGESLNILFDDILQYVLQFTNSQFGFIGAIISDSSGNRHLEAYSAKNLLKQEPSDFSLENIQFEDLEFIFHETLASEKTLLCNDATKMNQKSQHISSCLGLPIFDADGLVAMLGLANRQQDYDEKLIDELKPLINTLSSIINSSRHYEVIEEMAKRDSLTKAFNRASFDEKLAAVLACDAPQNGKVCLLVLDLDRFKVINDQYGHSFGDELLIRFSDRIHSILEDGDFAARLGGDEFVIVLQNIKHPEVALERADVLLKKCGKPYIINNASISCFTSIGMACFPDSASCPDGLFKRADFALYKAKEERNKVVYFSNDLEEQFKEQTYLEDELVKSFDANAFYCYYQPQLDSASHQLRGFELLLRWNHHERGEIAPNVFIPIIETMGLGSRLNEYIIDYTVDHMAPFLNNYMGDQPLVFSINLSPVVHHLDEHILKLTSIIKEKSAFYNLDPNKFKFEFELTEKSLIQATASFEGLLKRVVQTLRDNNINFAIDDFGVEYSSITRLLDYSFDMLKIDRCFVNLLQDDSATAAKAIIRAIVSLGQDLNFEILAEGAETKKEVDIVTQLGCDYIQGYYFYKPLSEEDAIELLNQTVNTKACDLKAS